MPAGVASALAAHGIGAPVFPPILAQDPFVERAAIDTPRFVQTTTTFPYEPPFAAGEEPPTFTLTLGNETTSTHGAHFRNQYSVGLGANVATPDIFKLWFAAQAKLETVFTWTNAGST